MISAPGEPPGSRVSCVRMPKARSRSPSIAACVDLPVPSPPSNVMKRPRICPLLSPPIVAYFAPAAGVRLISVWRRSETG